MTRRSILGIGSVLASLLLCAAALASADAYSPNVTMSVTPPSGSAQTLTVHESGTATLMVNGATYGFRPTMLDDQGTRTTVTVFAMPTATKAASELGEVQVKLGAAPVTTKTTPAFKIAVTKVDKKPM
jgi:hypothetical protein